MGRIHTALALLIPAFSLVAAPAVLPLDLLSKTTTLPYHEMVIHHIRGFGAGLEPRDIVGASALDQ